MLVPALIITASYLLLSSSSSFATGLCSAPDAPVFYGSKPNKPYVPLCINEISKTHTCDEVTVERYNSDVELYNSQLRAYISSAKEHAMKLNQYLLDAKEFATCEMTELKIE